MAVYHRHLLYTLDRQTNSHVMDSLGYVTIKPSVSAINSNFRVEGQTTKPRS